MPAVSAAVRSSTSTLGVPTRPISTWYRSKGSTPEAYRNSDASRMAVAASKWPL